jgi:hypothetical protein
MPRAVSSSSSSRWIRAQADGSWKMTVPTPTRVAPARISSRASRPVRTPPAPMIGTSGRAWRVRQMHRTAIGRMAGPDRPPMPPARAGRMVPVSMARPATVLIMDRASAPAAAQARATVTMSVTSGDSLATTGMS